MDQKINKLKNIDWFVKCIIAFFVGIISSTWFVFSTYNNFNTKINEIMEGLKTTKQMALKSIIWNEDIPLSERASSCDIYLEAGYNSLTKKECLKIID